VFGIDEVTLYGGEWNDKKYAVAGDVLDGVSLEQVFVKIKFYILFPFQYLYDLLMNLLEEKGISNDFAEKLSELSTSYEHSAYIALLESISKFTVGK
jgi:complement component 1 Q subcomponent-binding protein, mitochondrial